LRINYNTVSRKYYVVTEHSGTPAADFYSQTGKTSGGVLVPQERDSSAKL